MKKTILLTALGICCMVAATSRTKGNKGGHGTKGNQNATVTGAYSKLVNECFSPEELELFNKPIENKKEELEKEVRTLEIREYRLLNKIEKIKKKDKDLTIMKMSKYGTATSTDAENTDILLIRLEDALRLKSTQK